jgi:hypothetical protein
MLGLWKLRYEATTLWGTPTQHLLDLFTFTKRKPALIRFPCLILEVLLVKMFSFPNNSYFWKIYCLYLTPRMTVKKTWIWDRPVGLWLSACNWMNLVNSLCGVLCMIALFEFPSSKLISAHYDPWLLLECDTVSSDILIKILWRIYRYHLRLISIT